LSAAKPNAARRVDPDSHITRWEHAPNGNETALVDARDQRTTSAYDALDRLITTTDPRNRVTTYTYNGYVELTRLLCWAPTN
jgi:YD repeat-containing protein